MRIKTRKSRGNKKFENSSSKISKKNIMQKQEMCSHNCMRSKINQKTTQLENYKAFLQYLLSSDFNSEPTDNQ